MVSKHIYIYILKGYNKGVFNEQVIDLAKIMVILMVTLRVDIHSEGHNYV